MADNKPNFKAGQSVLCRVDSREPGGYAATLLPAEVAAFLPSQQELKEGETVPATFVCMSNNRALMTFAYMLGTTEKVQFGLPSEEETAFAVWADSYPRTFEVKRAIDMIMPNPEGRGARTIRCGDFDVEKLLKDLEASKLTGCIKAESEEVLSRSAAILFKGRAVGSIYTRKDQETKPRVESCLRDMLADMQLEETSLMIYELPSAVVLSMSALFFGVPVAESEGLSPQRIEELVDELSGKDETACLSVGSEATFHCLGFLFRGERFGSFSVADQKFEMNLEQLVRADSKNGEASVYLLPKEMTSDSVLFGYSMSGLLSDK